MEKADYLKIYAEGWTKGDANIILKAASDHYTFDDPSAGKIARSDFAAYLSKLKDGVRSARGGSLPEPFMQLSEVVTQEGEGVLTAWCWWTVHGAQLEGSGLIKVGANGVRSEVITYYAKPAV